MTLEEFDDLVSAISERAYCSGWQAEIEMQLWLITVGARAPRIGQSSVTADELRRLREHLATGTWVAWSDGAHGAVLVPLVTWLEEFDSYRAGASEHWLFERK